MKIESTNCPKARDVYGMKQTLIMMGVIEIIAVFFTLMMVCCLLHTTIICHFAKLDWRALYEYNYA